MRTNPDDFWCDWGLSRLEMNYSKTCVKLSFTNRQNKGVNDKCSDNRSWKPICSLVESGCFTQVLLYWIVEKWLKGSTLYLLVDCKKDVFMYVLVHYIYLKKLYEMARYDIKMVLPYVSTSTICAAVVNQYIWASTWVCCFDTLRPSQQFFSNVRTISCFPGLNQYLAVDKVSCSRTQQWLHRLCVSN